MKHKPPPMNNILSLFFYIAIITRNNQRLRSAGDNDRRSKHFCSNAVLCLGAFTWQIVKTHVIRLRGVEGRNTRDQIVFCALVYSFLVEVKANDGLTMPTHMRRMRNNNLEIRIAGSSELICW